MPAITRRHLLQTACAAAALPAALRAAPAKLRIGVTDWNLGKGANPESVALAAKLGFEGVEVSFGRRIADNKLPLDNPDVIAQYLTAFKQHGIAIAGACVDALHVNCLMNDPQARKWVSDGIRLSKQLNAKVMLLPFFGKCAMTTNADMDGAAAALKDLAAQAAESGLVLGLENTISAENSVRIIDKVGSPAVKVYFDAGNSFNWGHDPVKELRWLGASRICQIHIKDNPHFLGEGPMPWPELLRLIRESGFQGFANLETSSPSKHLEADMQRNLAWVRRQLNAV